MKLLSVVVLAALLTSGTVTNSPRKKTSKRA
jgi:hypothetical protein